MQAKVKKVSISQRSSKLTLVVTYVGWFSNIFTTKFMYLSRIYSTRDNIKINCIFTFFKIFKGFNSKNLAPFHMAFQAM
jgi:hypothetical protein